MLPLPFPHEKNVPLSRYCSFRIGGPARYLAKACKDEELLQMILFCKQAALRFFILGKGSNCLFDDRGYNGLVILNRLESFAEKEGVITVGAGYSFARLGKISSRLGYTGLEFASGIPATVGGAIYMNAGANGQETKDPLQSVDFITDEGEKITYLKKDLTFSYRFSSLQTFKGAITSAVFALQKSTTAKGDQQTLLSYRMKTQPYKDFSAGCVFCNPSDQAAGALIEACGLKGAKVGGAQVSLLHANFIVNADAAKADDVKRLMEKIRECVYVKTGHMLIDEIRKIPYDSL